MGSGTPSSQSSMERISVSFGSDSLTDQHAVMVAMEAAGCTVEIFEADALCIACEGGPTCLTRPILRQ